jgi:hypothetical protein
MKTILVSIKSVSLFSLRINSGLLVYSKIVNILPQNTTVEFGATVEFSANVKFSVEELCKMTQLRETFAIHCK